VDSRNNGWPSAAEESMVSDRDAREELERILSDPEFHCTERNRKFLRFVSEELFHGRENAVKAYSIAVDVFGRPPSFDPSTDPIVRIEATRLRAALVRYYELHGHDRPVRIELPKGRYVPAFSRASVTAIADPAPAPEPARKPAASPRAPQVSRLHPGPGLKWASVSLGIAGGVLLSSLLFAVGLFEQGHGRAFSGKPSLSIEMRLTGTSDDEAAALRDSLTAALSRFQTLRIASPELFTASTAETAPTERSGPASESRYRLLLKYSPGPLESAVSWQVVDLESETVRSGDERLPLDKYSAPDVVEHLVSRLAFRLASTRGVINNVETARESEHPTFGNGCILRANLAVDIKEGTALRQAASCLEETLRVRPNDADAHATLAAVLLKTDTPDNRTELTDKAVAYASRAVALAPDSDRSQFAQMIAQFKAGHHEAAIQAGRRAIALNPYNAAVTAKLGHMLFTVGRWEEGVALALAAARFDDAPLKDAETTFAFDAYRRGEFGEALQRLKQMADRRCYCLQLLRVATLGQLDRQDEAAAMIAEIRRTRPEFERFVRTDLANRQFALSLASALESGLVKAGLKIEQGDAP